MHDSIVEKLLGIVIFDTISELFDFKNIRESAKSAAGAVICVFTVLPSLIELHLFSLLAF